MLALGLAAIQAIQAQALVDTGRGRDRDNGRKSEYVMGLYEPTYFSLSTFSSHYDVPDSNINNTDPFHFSFLVAPYISVRLLPTRVDDLRFFVLYRGMYDFYYGSVYSGPVISRLQNPEMFFDWKTRRVNWQFAFGHESNGMFVERQGQYDSLTGVVPHRPEGHLPMNPQDFASMGWNYYRLSASKSIPLADKVTMTLGGDLKYHVDENVWKALLLSNSNLEDGNFFTGDIGRPKIHEYDGVNLNISYYRLNSGDSFSNYFYKSVYVKYALKTGYAYPFQNIGGQLLVAADVNVFRTLYRQMAKVPYLRMVIMPLDGFSASIPLYASWNHGYSENLAYYAMRYDGWGKWSLGVILIKALHDNQ